MNMSSRQNRFATALSVGLLIVVGLVVEASNARGQSATATLSGTVEDPNGAAVPGATVTVENPATGLQRQAITSSAGYFTFPPLPPSTYTVRVEGQGFAPLEISNVVLNVVDQKALLIKLQVT